jgi:hypothetical protein
MQLVHRYAEAGVEGLSGVSAAAAERAAPAVAVWSHGCAATWTGCQPRAAVWHLPGDSGDAIGGGGAGGGEVKQSRASAALERCLAGVTRRATAMLPLRSGAGGSGGALGYGASGAAGRRLLVLTHDHTAFNVDAGLFVTAAEEPVVAAAADGGEGSGGGGGKGTEAAAVEEEVEPCPICLEDPGSAVAVGALTAAVDDVNLSEYDLKNPAPFTLGGADGSAPRDDKIVVVGGGGEVLRVPCCSRAFCRGCLRDYLAAFPRGGCPHCRDVHSFTALAPSLGVSAAAAADAARPEPAPWREVSLLHFQPHPRLPAAAAPASASASSASREASSLASSLLSPDFLRGIAIEEISTAAAAAGGGAGDGDGDDGGTGSGSGGGGGSGSGGGNGGGDRGGGGGGDGDDGDDGDGDGNSNDSRCVPAAPSYVGYLGSLQGDDESLVPMERATMAVDEVSGRVVVLTRSGAAVLDAREETLEALFAS